MAHGVESRARVLGTLRLRRQPPGTVLMAQFVDVHNFTHHHTGVGGNTQADMPYWLAEAEAAAEAAAEAEAAHRSATRAAPRARNPEGFSSNTDPKILARPTPGWKDDPSEGVKHKLAASTPAGLFRLDKSRNRRRRSFATTARFSEDQVTTTAPRRPGRGRGVNTSQAKRNSLISAVPSIASPPSDPGRKQR